MNRFQRATFAFLLAGTAFSHHCTAGEMPGEIWFSSCEQPKATCSSATANSPPNRDPATPDNACGGQPTTAATVLNAWAAASRSHLPLPEAERRRLLHAFPGRTGQEVTLTCELQGPIDAEALAARYEWTVAPRNDRVELMGVPRDNLERLFYSQFIVTLDGTTMRPVALCILPPQSEPREVVALKPWIDPGMEQDGPVLMPTIALASAEASRPERAPVRTASLETEPIADRSDETADRSAFAVPPAPRPCFPASVPARLHPIPEPVEAPRP